MRGLYPVIDQDIHGAAGLHLVELGRALVSLGVPWLQLRAKQAAPRDTLALLRALVEVAAGTSTRVVANDRPDLALLAGAAGVHVGQSDLPLAEVRRFAPGLAVGVSTHSLEQLEAALAERPDYVAMGPVFATGSKAQPPPLVGLEGLALAHELTLRAGVPLVAIGGIQLERAPALAPHCEMGAVIAALVVPGEPLDAAARRLHLALGGRVPHPALDAPPRR